MEMIGYDWADVSTGIIQSYEITDNFPIRAYSYPVAKPSKVKSFKLSSKKRKVTGKWKTLSKAAGYQVAYKYKTAKKWTTVDTTNIKYTTKKLRKGKKVKLRVRAYKGSGNNRIYGPWVTKTVKVKK